MPTAARPDSRVVAVKDRTGRVASLNAPLRFVVIDFYLGELPQVGQLMSVFRQGQKVAQVKISGPEKSRNIAADIVTGDVKVGDEVRTD